VKALLRWASENVASAAVLTAVVLIVLDAVVRGIAWSYFGVLLPAFSLGWR